MMPAAAADAGGAANGNASGDKKATEKEKKSPEKAGQSKRADEVIPAFAYLFS